MPPLSRTSFFGDASAALRRRREGVGPGGRLDRIHSPKVHGSPAATTGCFGFPLMSPRSSVTHPRPRVSTENLISELASLDTDAARRKFLGRNRSPVRSDIVKKLAPAVVDKIRTDARAALRLAETAVLIARKLRRKEDIALALRAKANALFASDDNL